MHTVEETLFEVYIVSPTTSLVQEGTDTPLNNVFHDPPYFTRTSHVLNLLIIDCPMWLTEKVVAFCVLHD